MRKELVMKARYLGVAVILLAGTASGQMSLTPRTFRVDEITCGELTSLSGEQRDRVLIYFNGYLDGVHKETTWDERLTGRRIDEVFAKCRESPTSAVLHVFSEVWPR
jgi:HdeA/HdeB family protein